MVHYFVVLKNLLSKYRLWRWRKLKIAAGILERELTHDKVFFDQEDLAQYQGRQELLRRYQRQIAQLESKEQARVST